MSHLLDDPLPEGMFTAAEAAIIVFSRASTWFQPVTDAMWADLRTHFTERQCVEISFTVGLDQLVSRFHAMVRTDLDEATAEATHACAVSIPAPPSEGAAAGT